MYIDITISWSSAFSTNVLLIFDMYDLNEALSVKVSFFPPSKYMFVEHSRNIPRRYSQYIKKNPYSGEYSEIMFREYWTQEYSLIVPWISYGCYIHFSRLIKKCNSSFLWWIRLFLIFTLCLWKSNSFMEVQYYCIKYCKAVIMSRLQLCNNYALLFTILYN